jgi:hypothetical protein
LLVDFSSSNPLVAVVGRRSGEVAGIRPGYATLRASTTMFGVVKDDSVRYRIGLPIETSVFALTTPPGSGGSPEYAIVGVGAFVLFFPSDQNAPLNLEFAPGDLPNVLSGTAYGTSNRDRVLSFCGFLSGDCTNAGNVVITPPDIRIAGRVFAAPGTYDYRCLQCGYTGRVIVVDESTP